MTAKTQPESAPSSRSVEKPKTVDSKLLSAKVWEVYSPPPVNSFRGAVVPRILQKHNRRRKISVEVHLVEAATDKSSKAKEKLSYEECIVRVMDPANEEERLAARKRAKEKRRNQREHLETSTLDDGEDDDDDASHAHPELLHAASANFATPEFEKGWVTKYRFPIKALSIKGTHKSGVMLQINLGKIKQLRELIFDNIEEAESFRSVIEREFLAESERSGQKLKAAVGSHQLDLTETITLLVEIVSGWDLPAGDFSSSDPYVICYLGGREVHRTKYIPKTLDPIWTLKTGSLFLLTIESQDLFLSDGLLCLLKDYDKVGTNETLGSVTIHPKILFQASGERLELKLGPPPGMADEVPGHLAFRIRRATDYDIRFMKDYHSVDKKADSLGVKSAISEASATLGGKGNIKSLLTKRSRMAKHGKHAGMREYKIRPGPDPDRVEETAWMTKQEIQEECLKPSKNWIDTGSGRLGRLFVEIIGCEGLPNLDTGGFAGNKTDAFVSLVYEDSVVTTDIIDDTLEPKWMPWTKRAFIFHMYHSSSQLFLGVFDYDAGINPTDDHDLIGRVSVDLSNLRKDTLYTLKYHIYTTARMTEREQMGSITVRIRLEINDDRKLLLSNLDPPPQMYVNVKKRKDFRVVRYTCTGKYDMEKYSMKVINSYIEELIALQHVVYYLQDAVFTLLLWRGTFTLQLAGVKLVLPIHSITAFMTFTLLVEQPELIPSFVFAGIAWLMLASMDYRKNLPDVWSRCKTFREMVEVLIFGNSLVPPASIDANENHEAAREYLAAWEKRIKESEEAAEKAYQESIKAQEEYEKEIEELGAADTDISTKQGSISIDPFKPILYPVQQNLALVCRYVRHIKYILSWDECYIAFWITAGCLLLSFVFLFVPWFFLIKWSSRVIVWTVFGPWMKLVDIFYVSKMKPLSAEEQQEKTERERLQRRLATSALISRARIKRENAKKLKAMKKYMFGKFIIRVPVLKEDRYQDVPLPESTAVPYTTAPRPLSEVAMEDSGYHKTRMPGQHLVGDMIPRVDTQGFTEAPIGQATAHPRLVDKYGPAGAVVSSEDTTVAAYAKLGSLVLGAGILTWYGVPLLSAIAERALKMASFK